MQFSPQNFKSQFRISSHSSDVKGRLVTTHKDAYTICALWEVRHYMQFEHKYREPFTKKQKKKVFQKSPLSHSKLPKSEAVPLASDSVGITTESASW